MKHALPALLLSLGFSPGITASQWTGDARASGQVITGKPNVIIVLSDDQGYGDFSCHGNPVLKTPALDRLHNEGIRFGNFHVAPLCTPSRGQLLTGLDAMRNGAATVLTGRNLLRRDIVTMPEAFSQNGYATGIFGKWHLGDSYPDRPMDRGFQKCIWHKGWGLLAESEFDNDYFETRYLDGLETRQSGEYCTNLWFREAMQWMGEMAAMKKPFFSYIALNAPHGPYDAPVQDYNYYRPLVKDSITACFLGMIRNIDRNVARLDEWLRVTGLQENTIVIFMNDNGGTGGTELYNAGMRDKKGSNYEGGHRAACFMRWPAGGISGGHTIADPTQIQDLFPTLIELAALKVGAQTHFDGKSLVPLLKGETSFNDRMLVVQYGGGVKPEKYYSCVIWKDYRLVGHDELYDLSSDPQQQTNVAGQQPDIARKMRDFYETWWKTVEPTVNDIIPVIVGSPEEDPVILTSNNWVDDAVNTQWKVAQAGGAPRGGTTHIEVTEAGKYLIELSRWPFHLHRDLTLSGPSVAVGGTKIRAGRALPVQNGQLSLNGLKPVVKEKDRNARAISFEMELRAGRHTIQGWFTDGAGNELCGAYYIRIGKMNQITGGGTK